MVFPGNVSQQDTFPLLEDYVRLGLCPERPEILMELLKLAEEKNDWNIYRRVFEVMYSAIQDHSVELHWRCLCLDYIYRPLMALHSSASSYEQNAVSRACAWSVRQLAV